MVLFLFTINNSKGREAPPTTQQHQILTDFGIYCSVFLGWEPEVPACPSIISWLCLGLGKGTPNPNIEKFAFDFSSACWVEDGRWQVGEHLGSLGLVADCACGPGETTEDELFYSRKCPVWKMNCIVTVEVDYETQSSVLPFIFPHCPSSAHSVYGNLLFHLLTTHPGQKI